MGKVRPRVATVLHDANVLHLDNNEYVYPERQMTDGEWQ